MPSGTVVDTGAKSGQMINVEAGEFLRSEQDE